MKIMQHLQDRITISLFVHTIQTKTLLLVQILLATVKLEFTEADFL